MSLSAGQWFAFIKRAPRRTIVVDAENLSAPASASDSFFSRLSQSVAVEGFHCSVLFCLPPQLLATRDGGLAFETLVVFERRQRSEQNFTSLQFFPHFRRQVKGRPQAIQIFVGKSDFLTIFGTSKHSLVHFSEESNPLSIIELFQKRYSGAAETGRLLLTKSNGNLSARPRGREAAGPCTVMALLLGLFNFFQHILTPPLPSGMFR